MCIFRPSKLHPKKYVETTWIFRPSKWHRKKHVEATQIFWPAKLHKSTWEQRGFLDQQNYVKKSTWKRQGNDVKLIEIWSLTYWRNIDVKSTWIRGGVPVGHQFFQNVYPQKICFSYLLLFNSWKTKRRKRNISYDNRKTSAETVSFSSISLIWPEFASFSF